MTRQTVIAWRARHEVGGIEALADPPRSGRPPVIDEPAVITQTLNPPPPQLGVRHWSARLLADHLTKWGMPVSFAEVARIWRTWGPRPHRAETFKFSTDPQLEAKVRDVVATTSAANRSAGPRPPTRSSPKPLDEAKRQPRTG